jgi:cell division septation protein DedD
VPAPAPAAPAVVPAAPAPVVPQVNISPAQYTVYINIEGLDKVIEQRGILNPTGPTEIVVPVAPPARSTPAPRSAPRPAAAHTDTRETRIQIGAYSSQTNARDTVNKLRLAGFTPFSESYGNLTRVYITAAPSDVSAAIRRLANAGFKDPWVRD